MGPAPLEAEASTRQLPLRLLTTPESASNPPQPQPMGEPQEDGAYFSGAKSLTEAFEAIVYRWQSVQTAVSFASSSSSQSSNEDGSSVSQSNQLAFSFFQEVRSEELIGFRQRTRQVEEGLGTQRETYAEATQRISTRFEMSLSISGEALSNFAGASEELADKDELMGRLLDYTKQLLDKADEFFNEFFSALAGGESVSFEDLFNKLQKEFESGGLLDAIGRLLGEGAGAAAGAGNASASAAVQIEFNFSFSASVETSTQAVVQQSDPIILDLDNDGFELSSYQQGAKFDILGNGGVQNTAFVTGGDAFLAIDRNGNGSIDSGKELFGDQNGAVNGYEELRKLDQNRDGVINASDAAFDSLRLFRDNGNGKTETGELLTLREAGITEISLGYTNVDELTSGGNRMAQLASYRRADGSLGRAGDAILNYTA